MEAHPGLLVRKVWVPMASPHLVIFWELPVRQAGWGGPCFRGMNPHYARGEEIPQGALGRVQG